MRSGADRSPRRCAWERLAPLLLAATLAAGATAQESSPRVLEEWKGRLAECRGFVTAGEWKKARRSAEALLDQMARRSLPDDRLAELFAGAVAMRAIAEAGLGNDRAARWDWSMATSFSTDGAPPIGTLPAGIEAVLTAGGAEPAPRTDTRPEVRVAEYPDYPRRRVASCLERAIVVEAVVDTDGTLNSPRLESGGDPALSFTAMQALRAWEFEPARLDGAPVPALYSIWMTYDLPLCEAP